MRPSRANLQPAFSLPVLDASADSLTRNYWMQFMHELRRQSGPSPEARIQKAIVATAQYTRSTPEAVARVLVENGLCVQRDYFPSAFVTQLETRRTCPKWDVKAVTSRQRALLDFWDRHPTDYKQALHCH